jgi:RHS repeat-associated protein
VQLPSIGGGAQYQYLYDASGLRVGKATFTGSFPARNATCAAPGAAAGFALTNQYLLDQSGDQATELDGAGNWKHSNVWTGARLDASYDTLGLHFHLADPLGTRRVQANVNGLVENNFQSLPFGDELTAIPNPSCLPANNCYSEDPTEHHYTGKERDAESGNDYFGARYYASSMGRFMSPDWSAKEEPVPYAQMNDPQSLNLYAYVRNNPLTRVDADGHLGDIAVIEDGPTEGNPIGHTAIAITGKGVFSFGNGTPLGSSTTDYLQRESPRRDQTVTIIKTTPAQDEAAAKELMKQDSKGGINKYPDNCSARSNAGLDAAGVPQVGPDSTKIGQQSPLLIQPTGPDPAIPGTAGARAQATPGSQTTTIPKGGTVPSQMNQFNPAPGAPAPKPENKKPQ